MRKLLPIGAILILAGCSSGGAPKSVQTLGHNVAPSEAPQGKFVAQAQADQKAAATALDCSGSASKIDDRLAAGQTFMTEENWLSSAGNYVDSGKVQARIASIDRAQGLIQKDGIKLGNDGHQVRFKSACRLDASGSNAGSIQCQNYANSKTATSSVVQHERVCNLKSDGKNDKKTDETGMYRFMNGHSVPALREVIEQTGDIECQASDGSLKPAGHGVLRSTLIASDQIPSSSGVSCSSASDVFQYDVIIDDHGVVQSLRKSELMDFRL